MACNPYGGLSNREREVIVLVSRGLTTPEIADRLALRPCTVDAIVRNAMAKLRARTRVQASVIAVANTWDVPATAGHPELTVEQRQLLRLLAEGHTLSEAAPLLLVSVRTAHRRLHAAREVMGVRSNVQAVAALSDAGHLAPAG